MELVWVAATVRHVHPGREYDVLEFYAGRSRIARMARRRQYRAMAHELNFDKPPHKNGRPANNAMDFNGSAGFSWFGRRTR